MLKAIANLFPFARRSALNTLHAEVRALEDTVRSLTERLASLDERMTDVQDHNDDFQSEITNKVEDLVARGIEGLDVEEAIEQQVREHAPSMVESWGDEWANNDAEDAINEALRHHDMDPAIMDALNGFEFDDAIEEALRSFHNVDNVIVEQSCKAVLATMLRDLADEV